MKKRDGLKEAIRIVEQASRDRALVMVLGRDDATRIIDHQPKTGAKCGCKRGQQRDNCPTCEGTGYVIDFAAIRARVQGAK